jgi:cobyric acid synthase
MKEPMPIPDMDRERAIAAVRKALELLPIVDQAKLAGEVMNLLGCNETLVELFLLQISRTTAERFTTTLNHFRNQE